MVNASLPEQTRLDAGRRALGKINGMNDHFDKNRLLVEIEGNPTVPKKIVFESKMMRFESANTKSILDAKEWGVLLEKLKAGHGFEMLYTLLNEKVFLLENPNRRGGFDLYGVPEGETDVQYAINRMVKKMDPYKREGYYPVYDVPRDVREIVDSTQIASKTAEDGFQVLWGSYTRMEIQSAQVLEYVARVVNCGGLPDNIKAMVGKATEQIPILDREMASLPTMPRHSWQIIRKGRADEARIKLKIRINDANTAIQSGKKAVR